MESPYDGRRYLRPADAAKLLGLAPQTLARWRVEGGKIPFIRIGRAILYALDDLQAFLEARKYTSTSQHRTLGEDRG